MSGSETEKRQPRVELAGIRNVAAGMEAERALPSPAAGNALADQSGDDEGLGRFGRAAAGGAQNGEAFERVALMKARADGASGEGEGLVGDAMEMHHRGTSGRQSPSAGTGFQKTPEKVTMPAKRPPSAQTAYQAAEAPCEKPPMSVLAAVTP